MWKRPTNSSSGHFCRPPCATCHESQHSWLAFALRSPTTVRSRRKKKSYEHAMTRQTHGKHEASPRRPRSKHEATSRGRKKVTNNHAANSTRQRRKYNPTLRQTCGNSVTNASHHFLVVSGSYPFSTITYHR